MDVGNMGGTCSSQRPNNGRGSSPSGNNKNRRPGDPSSSNGCAGKDHPRLSRHSVVSSLPDENIASLYPLADNYVLEDNGLRSPKSLAQLSTEAVCRSLPLLEDNGLPPGLPQDIVDDIAASLVKHAALNATTLRLLQNCELNFLSLAGSRGVTDDWLKPLRASTNTTTTKSTSAHCQEDEANDIVMQAMDESNTVFFNASFEDNSVLEEASSSTSSFHSASSTHQAPDSSTNLKVPRGTPGEMEMSLSSSFEEGKAYLDNSFDNPFVQSPQCFSQRLRGNSVTSSMTLLDLRGSHRLTDKGLMQLSDLSSLEIAKLDSCFSIQGRGLLALSMSHRLHSLSLANCRRLTDEAIMNISHLVSLEALSLDGCRCLTDRSMHAISSLLRLRKIDLSQCDLVTDGGLEHLNDLECLEELSLGWCRSISDTGIRILCSQPGRGIYLHALNLARINITDEGLKHLIKLKVLEELNLNGCSGINSSSLGDVLATMSKLAGLDVSYCPGILRSSWQGKINSLKRLEVCYSGVRDSHLSRLTDLPALEEINLDSCPVSDWAVSHLAGNSVVPNLISLDLADTDLSDLGMVHISKFKKLKRLSLFYCNVTNSSLRHLSALKDLEVLNLDSREISDAGLFHLLGLKNLKSLDIFSGRITDSGCNQIAKLKSLESLELCGGGITDVGCAILATLEGLNSLNLSQNDRITNRGAAALAALSNLKTLNLSNTRVNSGALIHFSDMKNLKSLAIYGCHGIGDPDGNSSLERLQNGLPNLRCVRLNNGPDDDGVISSPGEDMYEDIDCDSDYEQVIFSGPGRTGVGSLRFPSNENGSDSEMEDALNDGHQSDSSYSDHD